MYYAFPITVTANTAKATPVEESLKLTKGVIVQVSIEIPSGCKGMVYLAIYRGGQQVWPLNRGQAFNGHGVTIKFPEHYRISDQPLHLVARAWSPGTTYNHTLTIGFELLRPDEVSPWTVFLARFDKFFKIVGIGG